MLKVAYEPNYKIHNFYGKIVDDFASYELKINGEKIAFKEKKQNQLYIKEALFYICIKSLFDKKFLKIVIILIANIKNMYV